MDDVAGLVIPDDVLIVDFEAAADELADDTTAEAMFIWLPDPMGEEELMSEDERRL
jgi:hypothetical protein